MYLYENIRASYLRDTIVIEIISTLYTIRIYIITTQFRVNVLLQLRKFKPLMITPLIACEVLNRYHDDDTGKSDDEGTVTSGSLSMCTCVSRTQHVAFAAQPLLCAVGLFAYSELSHTQRTGFSPCLSSPPSPLCPTTRPRSLRAPRAPPLPPHPPPPPPPPYVPRSLSVPTARLSCGPWGRRLAPQVGWPSWLSLRLAGWLALPAQPPSRPPSSSPACVPPLGRGLPDVTCQPVASVHSRHFEQPVRSPLGVRARLHSTLKAFSLVPAFLSSAYVRT